VARVFQALLDNRVFAIERRDGVARLHLRVFEFAEVGFRY
jgi:hypothetical protein